MEPYNKMDERYKQYCKLQSLDNSLAKEIESVRMAAFKIGYSQGQEDLLAFSAAVMKAVPETEEN